MTQLLHTFLSLADGIRQWHGFSATSPHGNIEDLQQVIYLKAVVCLPHMQCREPKMGMASVGVRFFAEKIGAVSV